MSTVQTLCSTGGRPVDNFPAAAPKRCERALTHIAAASTYRVPGRSRTSSHQSETTATCGVRRTVHSHGDPNKQPQQVFLIHSYIFRSPDSSSGPAKLTPPEAIIRIAALFPDRH